MKEFRGSPAPWKAEMLGLDNDGNIIEWITCVNGGANIVCLPPEHEYASREFWEANSKLIATAPELLDALQSLMSHYEQHGQLLTWDVDIARQALEKALS